MKRERAMGINAVQGLADHAPERIVRAWIRPRGKRLQALETQLSAHGIALEHADDSTLDKLAGRVPHQGVVAEFQPREPLDDHGLEQLVGDEREPLLLLVLDGVQDPHNLGACLRTAAAAGAGAVVVPRDRAVGLTPAVRRAAAGGAELVPLAVVTNMARTLRGLADAGIWRIGLAADSGESLFSHVPAARQAFVLGGEERGMRRLTREHCDQLASIPMPGAMESLNVSVAAGITLFHYVAQGVGTCR